MIETRLKGLDISKDSWSEILPFIIKKYNNTKHSTIGMTPLDAKNKKINYKFI